MNKKPIVLVSCVVAAVIAVAMCVCTFSKGKDGITPFQRLNVVQYFAANPFEKEDGTYQAPVIAVSPRVNPGKENTFLGSKAQINTGAEGMLMNVAVNSNKEVVVAASYDDISEDSPQVYRVFKYMEENGRDDISVLFNLSEYSSLETVSSLIEAAQLGKRALITGVNENSVKYVKSFFSHGTVLCDYDTNSKRSIPQIRADGARGIFCTARAFDRGVYEAAKKCGLSVWVDCGSDVYKTVLALKLNVDGIVTDDPEFVNYICNNWGIEQFDGYWSAK